MTNFQGVFAALTTGDNIQAAGISHKQDTIAGDSGVSRVGDTQVRGLYHSQGGPIVDKTGARWPGSTNTSASSLTGVIGAGKQGAGLNGALLGGTDETYTVVISEAGAGTKGAGIDTMLPFNVDGESVAAVAENIDALGGNPIGNQ